MTRHRQTLLSNLSSRRKKPESRHQIITATVAFVSLIILLHSRQNQSGARAKFSSPSLPPPFLDLIFKVVFSLFFSVCLCPASDVNVGQYNRCLLQMRYTGLFTKNDVTPFSQFFSVLELSFLLANFEDLSNQTFFHLLCLSKFQSS